MDDYDEVHFYLKRANTNHQKQIYVKAIELSTHAIERIKECDWVAWGDEEAWGRRIRADCYLNTKDFDQAIQDADIAIRLNPNNAFIWAVRGETYWRKNEPQKAVEDLTVAIELDPKYAYAVGLRGMIFNHLEKYDQALDDFRQRIQIIPNDAWTTAQCGMVYKNMGNYGKAIEYFRKALEMDNNMTWVRNSLAESQSLTNHDGVNAEKQEHNTSAIDANVTIQIFSGEFVPAKSLVGAVVQIVTGNFTTGQVTTLTKMYQVSEENIGSLITTLNQIRGRLYVLSTPDEHSDHARSEEFMSGDYDDIDPHDEAFGTYIDGNWVSWDDD